MSSKGLGITAAEFERRMKEIDENTRAGEEDCHRAADRLMCDALRSLGYDAGVEIFEKMGKWYA